MDSQTQAEAPTHQHAFRAEIQQLLQILAHSLYADREIFLRELISNASDALHRIQFEMLTNHDVLNPDAELGIHISADEATGILTLEDNGIGMTEAELAENLGTIAHSGVRQIIEQIEASKRSGIIGNFGVGFYSAFVVSDEITVISRSFLPDAQAAVWRSVGDNTFETGPAERETRGTTVKLKLKADAAEFLQTMRLQQVVRKHSSYIAFPIYVGDEHINASQTALWRKEPRNVEAKAYDDFYRQISMDFEEPLTHMHLSTDAPLDLHAILFIRKSRERMFGGSRFEGKVQLYSRSVLIQEESKDLLPEYFRFVDGVVDSEDIPLNVARETVQSSATLTKLKHTLTGRLRKTLLDMAEKEPEKYANFWKEFGIFLKEGIAKEANVRDELLPLLRFHASKHSDDNQLLSLADYKRDISEGQTEIYYLFGNSLDSLRRSPHLEVANERGINVLLLDEVIDGFMLTNLREFDGLKLRSIDDPTLTLPGQVDDKDTPDANTAETDVFVTFAKQVLGERVADVRLSRQLRNSPARLVASGPGLGSEMERVYRMMGRDYTAPPKILEVNPSNPLVIKLIAAAIQTDSSQRPVTEAVLLQLYDNAMLLEGLNTSPTDMIGRLEMLMEAALRG